MTEETGKPDCVSRVDAYDDLKEITRDLHISESRIENIQSVVSARLVGISTLPKWVNNSTLLDKVENLKQRLYRYYRTKVTKSIGKDLAGILLIFSHKYDLKNNWQELERDIHAWVEWTKLKNIKSIKAGLPEKIYGIWYVYIANHVGINRTFIDISDDISDNKRTPHAKYQSREDHLLDGKIHYVNNELILNLQNEDKSYLLTFRAHLDNKMLRDADMRLSGIGLVNVNQKTHALPLILYKPQKNDTNFPYAKKGTKIESLLFQNLKTKDKPDEDYYFRPQPGIEEEIVQYLSLKSPLSSDRFGGDAITTIKEVGESRLKERGRSIDKNIAKDFDGITLWASITHRIGDKSNNLRVYFWRFKSHEFSEKIAVERCLGRSGPSFKKAYKGELRVHEQDYWFHLIYNKSKHKSFFGFKEPSQDKVIYLIGSAKLKGRRYATRELLIPMDYLPRNFIKRDTSTLKYQEFLHMDSLDLNARMYLNYRNHSILSYPLVLNKDNRYGQQVWARYYQGEYFVYFKGIYKKNHGRIVRYALSIDKISGAQLRKSYDQKEEGEHSYSGIAEKLDKTLYLHLSHRPSQKPIHQAKRQASRILFHAPDGDDSATKRDPIMVGIILDADLDGFPVSSVCIAVKREQIGSYAFKPFPQIEPDEELALERVFTLFYEKRFYDNYSEPLETLTQFFEITNNDLGGVFLHKNIRNS